MSEDTIFAKIIRGDIPVEKIYEDEHCICIHDIAPKAPVHVLLIPKRPIPKLADATPADQELLGYLMLKAADITRMLGIDEGFRLIVNNGAGGGQTVFHLHIHLMGNKPFSEGGMSLVGFE